MAASITGSITEKNLGAVNQAVQEKIDALHLPPGAEVTMGGVAPDIGWTTRLVIHYVKGGG